MYRLDSDYPSLECALLKKGGKELPMLLCSLKLARQNHKPCAQRNLEIVASLLLLMAPDAQ